MRPQKACWLGEVTRHRLRDGGQGTPRSGCKGAGGTPREGDTLAGHGELGRRETLPTGPQEWEGPLLSEMPGFESQQVVVAQGEVEGQATKGRHRPDTMALGGHESPIWMLQGFQV